jgi:phosphoribosylformimino-5-aminoimidazole carboxamide ribotide isomerase
MEIIHDGRSAMKIIPVIDLMGGLAVHAVRGHRESYRPLRTPLCRDPDPFAVVASYLQLHPFDTFYVADLDALTGRGRQDSLIAALQREFPGRRFWVDAGMPEEPPVVQGSSRIPVIGTESMRAEDWHRLSSCPGEWILSLDWRDGSLDGPDIVLQQPQGWPERVVVLTLDRVGSLTGPDWKRLEWMHSLAPNRRLIAAGGIHHEEDLRRLARSGVEAALVASALHFGTLCLDEIFQGT